MEKVFDPHLLKMWEYVKQYAWDGGWEPDGQYRTTKLTAAVNAVEEFLHGAIQDNTAGTPEGPQATTR